jgi:hypothetical protein
VTGTTEGVRSEVRQLASVLLADVEEIAERGAARMQELLPAYAPVPRAELVPVVLGNTRDLLEAVGRLDSDRARAEVQYRMFRSDHFADVSLSQWMGVLPPELVRAHLNLDHATIAALPRSKPLAVR